MFFKLYTIAFPVFLLIDMTWLALVANDFYNKQIGSLLKADVNWIAAVAFYLLFIAGIVVFVIIPSIEKKSFKHALFYGAFFGLVCYATYDLTNLAVAKDWPLVVTIVDLIWGSVIASFVSIITYLVVTKVRA